MKLIEVKNKKEKQEFLAFPKRLYKDDLNWICPLDVEINHIFDPRKNTCFQHGEAIRWLLKDDSNQTIGRIAAFIDHNKVDDFKQPTGSMGFFECIDDQAAANCLLDAAKSWLEERNMEAMIGPVNFGENFNYWGLLVDGFMPQAYALPYNPPYYQTLLEAYGFKNYFEQHSYHKDLASHWPERMLKFAEYTAKRPGYSFEHFKYSNVDKYVDDFVSIYNTIWKAFHDNYSPLQHSEIRQMVELAKPAIEERLIWFAYDKGKPVGLVVDFPDLNQVLAKLKNGKLNFINKLKFLYYKKRAVTRNRAFIAGVYPEYQNTGIIAALFLQIVKVLDSMPNQKELELSWVGDYNPKMMDIYTKMGAKRAKTHVTYMKLFDPEKPFERFTNEFEGKQYHHNKSAR